MQTVKKTTQTPQALLLLKRQLHWHLLLRVVVLSLLLGISAVLSSENQSLILPPHNYIAYFISGLYIFTILSALSLRYVFKNLTNFAYAQFIIDSVLATCLVYFTGGSQSIFIIIYFFPIITGGIMLFRTGGLLMASISTFGYALILALEYYGYHPNIFPGMWTKPLPSIFAALNYFTIHGISFFLVAILSFLLSERLLKTEAALSRTVLDLDRLSILYKQIINDISTGIITIDASGRINSSNRASEEITGYPSDEIIHMPLVKLFPNLTRNDGSNIRPQVSMARKNGEIIPIGYSWAKLNMPAESEDFWVYTFQDLSQIKMMEDQVRQAEKMAAIGEMAAGIAHEFRNPLAAMSGAAQVLAMENSTNTATQGLLKIIIRECDRMEDSISDFLQFSRPTIPKKKWFSVNGIIQETLDLLQQKQNWNNKCTVELSVPDKLDCWADPLQTKQLLLNLIDNASNVLGEEGGRIQISVQESTDKNSRTGICFKISDNGPGVQQAIQEKIFEPFFTTRENGTGLGLAIVRQIINKHEGTISIDSQDNKGTTFTFLLPFPT